MTKKKFVQLAINYGGHDTSAALSIDDKIIAATEQERYDLSKHSRNFPLDAINDCLKIANLKIKDINNIIITTNFLRGIKKSYIEPALSNSVSFKKMINEIETIKFYLNIKNETRRILNYKGKVETYNHHLCHLASAYYPSGFNKAIVLSLDGVGEHETGLLGIAKNKNIVSRNFFPNFPHSLGLIYSAITFFLGWKHHCDEGIIMGLAPYGNANAKIPGKKNTYIDIFRKIIQNYKKGFKINNEWISYHEVRDKWVSDKFNDYFGKKRKPNSRINQNHINIAAALQKRLEEIVLTNLKIIKKKYKYSKLCIAGGVGLNCSLNGKIAKSKIFKEIFIQPASGDAGLVIGGLYLGIIKNVKKKFLIKKRHNHYLGPSFSNKDIKKILFKYKNKISFRLSQNIYVEIAKLINLEKIIGWFQGHSEFGPRALGNRSILCKAYPSNMKDYLNKQVKFREYFRPFAPAVLLENSKEFFKLDQESAHMLIASQIKLNKKKIIPSVVHVDNTSRVQTVSKNSNLKFYNLIKEYRKLTSVPVILNTSFNVKGQPMVNTPDQAIKTFINTKIDTLAIGDFIVSKKKTK